MAATGSASTLAPESGWAVETHGLTKRFGQNLAVNGVELVERMRVWLPGP